MRVSPHQQPMETTKAPKSRYSALISLNQTPNPNSKRSSHFGFQNPNPKRPKKTNFQRCRVSRTYPSCEMIYGDPYVFSARGQPNELGGLPRRSLFFVFFLGCRFQQILVFFSLERGLSPLGGCFCGIYGFDTLLHRFLWSLLTLPGICPDSFKVHFVEKCELTCES